MIMNIYLLIIYMSIIINTNKDSGKHYLDIKRYLHSLLLSKKCSIEYYFYNFQKNDEIIQVIDNIYIGNYSSSTNKKLLLDNQITDILSIMPVFKPAYPKTFQYYHITAYNDCFQDLTLTFLECNTFINEILRHNQHMKYKTSNNDKDKDKDKGKEDKDNDKERVDNTKIRKLFIYCETGKSLSIMIILSYLIFLKQKERDSNKYLCAEKYSIINKTKHSLNESQIIDSNRRRELYSNHRFVELLKNNTNFYRISPDILLELLKIIEKKDISINEQHLFQLHNLFF